LRALEAMNITRPKLRALITRERLDRPGGERDD
jgi:hypothetical protein